jgi:hypothetical protein
MVTGYERQISLHVYTLEETHPVLHERARLRADCTRCTYARTPAVTTESQTV